jgi:serine/threonine protein phosphatase 1
MWIRNSFLDSGTAFECVVVHGHTPTTVVHADQRRIGLDTKAYHSGVLTAVRLEGRERTLLQTSGPREPLEVGKIRERHGETVVGGGIEGKLKVRS